MLHIFSLISTICRETLLYTEMVNVGGLIHNPDKLDDFIDYDPDIEPPLALQLGGSDPDLLGRSVELCEQYKGGHFSEINLNCGCPSNKAKKAGFGAELMLDPELVRRIVTEMNRKSHKTEITVKCRIGTNRTDKWEDLVGFVDACRAGGVRRIIVHARLCLLNGLSPAQNRTIPPLQYDVVHRLVETFPDMKFGLNGGVKSFGEADWHLGRHAADGYGREGEDEGGGRISEGGAVCVGGEGVCADDGEEGAIHSLHTDPDHIEIAPPYQGDPLPLWGVSTSPIHTVMIGREAYHNPWMLADADRYFYNCPNPGYSRREVLEKYLLYCTKVQDSGEFKSSAAVLCRPLHNYFAGCGGHYNRQYKRLFDQLIKDKISSNVSGRKEVRIDELVWEAVEGTIPERYLDQRMGVDGYMIDS